MDKMFCMQCEQTAGGKACTNAGVCGKTANTARLQDELTGALITAARKSAAVEDRLCLELEKEYGLVVDNGWEKARADRLSEKAAVIEAQTGQESFEGYAKRHKAVILKALEAA